MFDPLLWALLVVALIGWGGWIACHVDLIRARKQRDELAELTARCIIQGAMAEVRGYLVRTPADEACDCKTCTLVRDVERRGVN